MKRNQDRLLTALISGDEVAAVREASMARGLAEMRRSRRRRWIAQISGMSVTILALLLLAQKVQLESSRRVVRQTEESVMPFAQLEQGVTQIDVKVITDEELFALFPGRRLGLIGEPGKQQLVFFDEPSDPSSPGTVSERN